MKKKRIVLTTLGTFLCLGALYLSTSKTTTHTHAEGEKTKIYFNIAEELGFDASRKLFHFNTSLDSFPTVNTVSFNYYYNSQKRTSPAANTIDGGQLAFFYNDGDVPSGVTGDANNYYTHYQIKAETVLFTTETSEYVLEKDYNWWSSRGNGTMGWAYLFQHGGQNDWRTTVAGTLITDDVNSLKFTSFGGGIQDDQHRFLFQPSYEETSTAWTTNTGEMPRNPIFIDKGNGYELHAASNVNPVIWADGIVKNQGEQLLFILQYSQLFGSDAGSKNFNDITMDNSYYSFYIPDGTLWGGIQNPIMIEGDYYFEITKDGVQDVTASRIEDKTYHFHGFYNEAHNYVKHDAKAPTCSSEGNVEYYTCDRVTHAGEEEYFIKNSDGSYTATTKEAVTLGCTAHDFVVVAEVPASSGQHGTAAHYKCSTCDKVFTSADKDSEVTLDSLILHDYVKHEAKAATCEEDGNVEYYTCSACDKYFLKDGDKYNETTWDNIKIAATHKYGEEIGEVSVSETTHGKKAHYECSECHKLFVKNADGKYVETSEEALLIHNLKDVAAKEATCTEGGTKAHKECSCEGCNKLFVIDASGELKETSLEALTTSPFGHRYSAYVFDEDNMTISHSCSRCNEVEIIAVNEENGFVYKVIKESTTTTQGEATWTHSIYGTFTVKLPLKAKANNAPIIIGVSAGVGVVLVGVGLCLFFVLKKKKA